MTTIRGLAMRGLKTGGRKAGTPNKISNEYRQLLAQALEGEIQSLPETLASLPPQQRVDAIIKLLKYLVGPVESVRSFDIYKALLDLNTHRAGLNREIETEKLICNL